ncbi:MULTISPECIES: competence protein ComK [Metabacillus]|uniref:Competence protein ComK n=1 Tax=Metabacillus rhizolycopersici TaxID=2875709 RepID=A0ABS7V0F6_9BACI|nr:MULTISPECIES: competence protein ComK [Metabacillus]MBZ5753677.1 competence protein ComK [Metabacillus rhizolycopersici]MCM3652876.1 competence protein ComK [Metabacillus litoralis]
MNYKLMKLKEVVEKNTYIIKEDTMAILPWYTNDAELRSHVLERFQIKNVAQKPLTIVKGSCHYYASDLSGRLKAASTILKGKRMLPVLISESNRICMVPLGSPSKPECIWLSFRHVVDIIPNGTQSIVIFSNNQRLELDITRDLLEAKLDKAARLLHTYQIRQENVTDHNKMQILAEEASLYSIAKDGYEDQLN